MNTVVVGGATRVSSPPHESNERIPNFERLLGPLAWNRLPQLVQARFRHDAHATATTVVYRGITKVDASLTGRAVAHVCRLIGTPVAPYVGAEVAVSVRVFATDEGIVWERHYDFGDKKCVVSSTKQLDRGGLVEKLGAGLNMRLKVLEIGGALHFVSDGYFFRVGSFCIDLPDWFLPGGTRVVHQDLGNGKFRFTMHTEHRWLGVMFDQDGVFH